MKFTLIMERVGDFEELEFSFRDDAIGEAKMRWSYLTSYERAKYSVFEVIMDDRYVIADFIHQYTIRDRVSWTIIEERPTLLEAYIELKWFEIEDKRDGVFEPNFYEIVRNGIVYDHIYKLYDKRLPQSVFYGNLFDVVSTLDIDVEIPISDDSYSEIRESVSEYGSGMQLERIWINE